MDGTDVGSWGPPPPTLREMAEIPAQSIFSDAQELTNPTCAHRATLRVLVLITNGQGSFQFKRKSMKK